MVHNVLTLYINCGITPIEVDNNAYPTRLSLMFKATCLIEHPIPCVSMPEVTEMIACPTFMSHFPNEPLLSSGHSRDCQVSEAGSLT